MTATLSAAYSDPTETRTELGAAGQLDSLNDPSIKCLVIFHNDSMLARRLAQAVEERSVMWRIPQSEWGFERQTPSKPMQAISQRGDLQRIVLAGHSQGVVATKPTTVLGPEHDEEPKFQEEPASNGVNTYHGLMHRVQSRQQSLQQAKEHFVRQIEHLRNAPAVAQRIESGSLELNGVFYIAESGTFLLYNASTGALDALPQSAH